MSKKKLLSENEIRRFQGLAGIPALGEGMYGKPMGGRHEEEEEMDEAMHADPAGEREDMPMDDMEMDVEMEPSDEGGESDLSPEQKEDLAADIVRAVAQELSQALDLEEPIEVETDGGKDMEMDMEMDMDMDDEEAGMRHGGEEEPGMRADMMEEEEGVFAPNHYCVHHGGVHHEGKIHMAEAVGHNWSDKYGRVTHYDMKLENGTVLENVAFEDIQVTNASLAEAHHKHVAKRHADEEEELDESNNDDLVSEVLRRVVARLSNK